MRYKPLYKNAQSIAFMHIWTYTFRCCRGRWRARVYSCFFLLKSLNMPRFAVLCHFQKCTTYCYNVTWHWFFVHILAYCGKIRQIDTLIRSRNVVKIKCVTTLILVGAFETIEPKKGIHFCTHGVQI